MQPDLVDDHDAVAVEDIAPGLDAFEKGRDRGALGDAGRPQIGCLAPGQGDAEHLAPVGFPGLHQRGESGALAGAGNADRHAQPAAGGEPCHHRPLGLPLLGRRIDRRIAREESICRAVDLRRRQSRRQIERGGLGQPDQLAFLVDMQRRRDTPALLAAQGSPPAPQQRHLLAVLYHAPLAEAFQHSVDVVAGSLADAGHDQCPRRDLAQFPAVQHGTAAELPLEQWQGRAIGGLAALFRQPGQA